MMSFYGLPMGVEKRMNFFRARLLWQENNDKKKYHLVKCAEVCKPKDMGGLGIENLAFMNRALLCKWWWKIYNTKGLWQENILKKYQGNKATGNISAKQGDSQFWRELLKHRDHFTSLCKFVVGDGGNTRFREDWWIGSAPLCKQFPRLYNICFDKKKTVKEVVEGGIDNIQFRRTLTGDSRELWEHIKEACNSVVLTDGKDNVKWTLTKKGIYTLKSFYRHLVGNGINYPHLYMWKIKIPPRVKVFMWLALRNSILTKDNLLRRGWKGDDKCPFYGRKRKHQSSVLDLFSS